MIRLFSASALEGKSGRLSFVLFWLGLAATVLAIFVGLMSMGFAGKIGAANSVLAVWGLIALVLAQSHSSERSKWMRNFTIVWAAIGIIGLVALLLGEIRFD